METFELRDNTALSYYDVGEGQPVIFLHGFMGNKEYFADLIKHFQDKYRVVALDQRGHGLSSGSTKNRTLTGLAHDLKEFIEKLDLHDVVLVGESMGGMVILKYVDLFGCGNVARIALCDTSPKCLNDENWEHGMYFDSDTPLNSQVFHDYLLGFAGDYEKQMEQFSMATMRGLPPERMTAMKWPPVTRELQMDEMLSFFIAMVTDSSLDALDKINIPVLLVHADPGSLFLPAAAEYMQSRIAGATRVTIGKTHLFSLEEPELYTTALEDFLA